MINIIEIKIYDKIINNENLLKELFYELNCVIFLVDATSEESFKNFLNLISALKNLEIIKNDSNYLTTLLVLNKTDLNEERKITVEKIKEFKDSNPLFDTVEISLKTQNNIEELTSKLYNAFNKKENIIFPIDNIKEYENQYSDDFMEDLNLNPEGTINCILIGDSETGKSSFLIRYFKNEFSYTFLTTIGTDKEVKMVKIKDKLYKFVLWDTAGQERFRSIPGKYFQNAHGIFLLYDVNKRNTFNDVEKWMEDVKNNISSNKKTNIYLIGNKIDLERVVTKEEGIKMANAFGLKYFECSNKLNLNIQEIMSHMIIDCYENIKKDDNKGTKLRKGGKKKGRKC